jgi:hypothetical protein
MWSTPKGKDIRLILLRNYALGVPSHIPLFGVSFEKSPRQGRFSPFLTFHFTEIIQKFRKFIDFIPQIKSRPIRGKE